MPLEPTITAKCNNCGKTWTGQKSECEPPDFADEEECLCPDCFHTDYEIVDQAG